MPLPLESSDPAVRSLAARRDRLRCEMVAMETLLNAYADSSRDGLAAPVVSPLGHSAMLDDGEECGCAVCTEWRQRRDECEAAMRLVPEGHRWSICACADCRFVGRMHLNYVAAANVRDLVIEMAFHAGRHSRHGEAVMRWLTGELASPKYTVRWCAYEIGRRPVEEWLAACETALSPALSGKVFAVGEGEREALAAWLPSQLGAAMASAPMAA